LDHAEQAIASGHVVAVIGEQGVGKNTLALHARRAIRPRERVVTARVPNPEDINGWLALWTPELNRRDTYIILSGIDSLPAWVADELTDTFTQVRRPGPQPFIFTAADYKEIPDRLAGFIDIVVELPALRLRGPDVLRLAQHFGRQERRRPVRFTPAATRALTNYDWPGNAKQLKQVIQIAAARADVIDTHHLDPQVFTSGAHTLTRLEMFERDELIRCLNAPNVTVAEAAAALGVSRATVYRKIAHHGLKLPRRSGDR